MHGLITEAHMLFVTVGITAGTPMPETAMKFVDHVGVLAVTILEEPHTRDAILARIACVLNVMVVMGLRTVWVDLGHETMMGFQTFRAESVHDGLDVLASLLIAPG